MFYTIYKITNLIDGKIYIGKHQTKDLNDSYFGSGKQLRRAISKHGIENFQKEILFQFDNEAEMNAKEAELVTEEFCLREDTYNLCPGGKGGWGYLNSEDGLLLESRSKSINAWNLQARQRHLHLLKTDSEYASNYKDKSILKAVAAAKEKYPNGYWKGKKLSKETKDKISEANRGHNFQTGKNNSQFGTMWITDGVNSKKIDRETPIPEGWYKGRKVSITPSYFNGRIRP